MGNIVSLFCCLDSLLTLIRDVPRHRVRYKCIHETSLGHGFSIGKGCQECDLNRRGVNEASVLCDEVCADCMARYPRILCRIWQEVNFLL